MLAPVDPPALIKKIEGYLRSRGIEICAKPFQIEAPSAGGLVKLNGRALVVVDSKAPDVERLMALAEALCALEFEPALLPPEVQSIVVKVNARRRWKRRRLVGKRNLVKPLWLQSKILSRRPGLHICPSNDNET
jgi:hypothetical protein